jgi:hypothetical protein
MNIKSVLRIILKIISFRTYLFFFQAILLLYSFELNAQTFTWAKIISNSTGYGISVDASGNSYVTGLFNGTAVFDTIQLFSYGYTDVFVAKYNKDGNCIWAKQAGGINNDCSYSISVDKNGNSYITGFFYGIAKFDTLQLISSGSYDIFLAKYNKDGNCIWAKQAGGSNDDFGYFISVDINGNSYITGEFRGTATFGLFQLTSFGSSDAFVAKYDPNGNCLWAKQAGGVGSDFGEGLTVDANGNIYVTGYFQGPVVFGENQLSGFGSYDIFIAKYDSFGNCLWAKQAGSPFSDGGTSISVDANGNCYVTGKFTGPAVFGTIQLSGLGNSDSDIFVAEYDLNGNCLWAKQAGGTGYDAAWGISTDAKGNCYVTGQFTGPATFGTIKLAGSSERYIFVTSYDFDGNCLWAVQDTGYGVGTAIVVDTIGNVYSTGAFSDSATFGTFHLTGGGGFITKIHNSPLGVKNEINPFHKDYFLEQNYPNPFNPCTSIKFSLPKASHVKLSIYNSLGQEVSNLISQDMIAGIHSIDWNASSFASGVYYYRIVAGNFIDTKKLLLLK